MTTEPAGLTNLRTAQRQLDADGTEVGVSRQALEETLAYIDELRAPVVIATPSPVVRRTHTYSTTNIVILEGHIYAEDFSHKAQIEAPERVGLLIDPAHFRKFGDFQHSSAMHHFTMWLQDVGAVVDKCWILGPELSDSERKG
jgi:hypothetical protein